MVRNFYELNRGLDETRASREEKAAILDSRSNGFTLSIGDTSFTLGQLYLNMHKIMNICDDDDDLPIKYIDFGCLYEFVQLIDAQKELMGQNFSIDGLVEKKPTKQLFSNYYQLSILDSCYKPDDEHFYELIKGDAKKEWKVKSRSFVEATEQLITQYYKRYKGDMLCNTKLIYTFTDEVKMSITSKSCSGRFCTLCNGSSSRPEYLDTKLFFTFTGGPLGEIEVWGHASIEAARKLQWRHRDHVNYENWNKNCKEIVELGVPFPDSSFWLHGVRYHISNTNFLEPFMEWHSTNPQLARSEAVQLPSDDSMFDLDNDSDKDLCVGSFKKIWGKVHGVNDAQPSS